MKIQRGDSLLPAVLLLLALPAAKAAEGAGEKVRPPAAAPLPNAPPAAAKPSAPPPPKEVRAIWVTRWDYRTEDDVRKVVERCAGLGFNQVVFQVRGQADAYYRSSLEPWGEELEAPPGQDGDPGFDPLEVAIDEARKRGLELHAWFNVLPGWKGSTPPRSRRHLVHTHPDWFLTDQAGRRKILGDQHYAMLNPCLPAVREHLAAVAAEIAARYPVAGIQLDYIRFLDRNSSKGEDVPFDPPTLERFRQLTGATPRSNSAAWDLFRRQGIDRVVEAISSTVRRRRPGCVISVAAIRDREHARARLFQDAESWLKRGWVDLVYPMNYEREPGRFAVQAREWIAACGGAKVVLGIGVHLLGGPPEFREQVRLARAGEGAQRAAGYCLFAYGEFFPTPPRARPEPPRKAGVKTAAGKAPPAGSPAPEPDSETERLQSQRRAVVLSETRGPSGPAPVSPPPSAGK